METLGYFVALRACSSVYSSHLYSSFLLPGSRVEMLVVGSSTFLQIIPGHW